MNEKKSPYRWLILGVGCLAVAAAFINMTALSPMLEIVAEDLNVELGTALNLMSVFLFSQGVFLIFGGAIADRFGITVSLASGMLCAAIASVLMPLIGTTYWTVLVLRIFQGAAIGLVFGVIGLIVAHWFPVNEQGIAGALFIGALNIGTALGVWIGPVFLNMFGTWQTAVAMLSVFAWINLILVLLFTRKKPAVIVRDETAVNNIENNGGNLFVKALKTPVTWVGCFLFFFNAWAIFGLYNMVPTFLAASKPVGLGLGSLLAGKLSVALTFFGICGTICGGLLLDKVFKGKYRISVVLGFVITGLFGFMLLNSGVNSNLPVLTVVLLLAGFGCPMMDPAINAFVAINYDPKIVGRVAGLMFGFGSFGSPLVIAVAGKVVDRTGYAGWAVALCCSATLIGVVLSVFLKSRTKTAELAGQSEQSIPAGVEAG